MTSLALAQPLATGPDLRVVPTGERVRRRWSGIDDDANLLINEAADFLWIHVNTVRRMCNRGELPFFLVGKRHDRRFRLGDLRAWQRQATLSYAAVYDTRPAANPPTAPAATADGHAEPTALRSVRPASGTTPRAKRLASSKERAQHPAPVHGANVGRSEAELAGLVLRTNNTSAGIEGRVSDWL